VKRKEKRARIVARAHMDMSRFAEELDETLCLAEFGPELIEPVETI
jgi:hypothetical protein